MSTGEALKSRIRFLGAQVAAEVRTELEKELKRSAPVGRSSPYGNHEPGTLRDSCEVSVRFDQTVFRFTARAKAPHASFTNDGTAAHPIIAVNATVLRFDWPKGGQHPAFYRRIELHPGNAASHWFDKALARYPDIRAAAMR
jgi:hypothetical protein